MIKHPEVLRKAQEEIDTVVGNSRLPTFSDRSSLPYVEAMLTETLRWACPAPLSTFRSTFQWIPLTPHADFPHLSTGDVYEGYRIPKGAYVGIYFTDFDMIFDFLTFRCLGTYG